METNENQFIIELEALSKKYNIKIGGCGCCGSPALDKMEDDENVPEAGYSYESQLMYVSPADKYDWEHYSQDIVKCLSST